jgi:hypothetical protein
MAWGRTTKLCDDESMIHFCKLMAESEMLQEEGKIHDSPQTSLIIVNP